MYVYKNHQHIQSTNISVNMETQPNIHYAYTTQSSCHDDDCYLCVVEVVVVYVYKIYFLIYLNKLPLLG